MKLSEDVHRFCRGCEALLSSIATHRPLTDEEIQLILQYCNEVLSSLPKPTGGESVA